MKNPPNKKAQMEILGLAIVVVLLILGMVFVIQVIAQKKQPTIKDDVYKSELATGFISTYLATNVPDCNGLTITELAQDCAAHGGISCTSSQGASLSSCDKAKEVASILFSRTLDQWKLRYFFSVNLPKQTPLLKLGTPCAGERQQKIFTLPSRAGTLQVVLDICR